MKMKYQSENKLEDPKSFLNTLQEIIDLSDENYSVNELIGTSILKISNYAKSNKYYFFILDENESKESYINYSDIEEYQLTKLIKLHPEINFERFLKLINENRDIIVCDTNGILLTDINKTDITEYYLGLPLISDQLLIGSLLLKFNKGYEKVFDQVEFIMILLDTFLNILQKKLLLLLYKNSSHQFRRMVNDALNGIYQSTEDGRIIYANPAFLRIIGYNSFDELKKIDLFKDMYFSANQRVDFINKIKKQKKVHNYESLLKNKDGNKINIIENSQVVEWRR